MSLLHRPFDGGPLAGGVKVNRELAHPRVWWIWFNVRRDLDGEPTATPGLTSALLSGVQPVDVEAAERHRALFE